MSLFKWGTTPAATQQTQGDVDTLDARFVVELNRQWEMGEIDDQEYAEKIGTDFIQDFIHAHPEQVNGLPGAILAREPDAYPGDWVDFGDYWLQFGSIARIDKAPEENETWTSPNGAQWNAQVVNAVTDARLRPDGWKQTGEAAWTNPAGQTINVDPQAPVTFSERAAKNGIIAAAIMSSDPQKYERQLDFWDKWHKWVKAAIIILVPCGIAIALGWRPFARRR